MLMDRADDCFAPRFDTEKQNWLWLYFHTKDPRPGETLSMRHIRVAQFCLANAELSRFNGTPFDARRRMEQNKLWLLMTTTPAGIPRFDIPNEPGRVEEISEEDKKEEEEDKKKIRSMAGRVCAVFAFLFFGLIAVAFIFAQKLKKSLRV